MRGTPGWFNVVAFSDGAKRRLLALAAVLPPGRVGLALRAASAILATAVMLYYPKLVPPR